MLFYEAKAQYPCAVNIPPALYRAIAAEAEQVHAYQESTPDLPKNIPVHFTFVQPTVSAVTLSQGEIDAALLYLNNAFSGTNFLFYQCGPLSYLQRTEVLNNPDVDNFTTMFSYNQGAMEVYVRSISPYPSSATIPCPIAFQSGNPNNNDECLKNAWVDIAFKENLQTATFPHETGHYFGLFHTFERADIQYNTPVLPTQADHPYPVLDASQNIVPYWWGRELVIRTDEPSNSSKPFRFVNSDNTGDFVEDTPADCTNFSGIFWGCPLEAQLPNCDFDPTKLLYKDYNNDPIYPAPSGYTLGRNFMSYWNLNCRDHFTPKQKVRAGFYFNNYRKNQFKPDLCGNLVDKVEYEGSGLGLKQVSVRIRHDAATQRCNAMTDQNGNFSGLIHADQMRSSVYHNGRKSELVLGNDPLRAHYDHTRCEWLRGVDAQDLAVFPFVAFSSNSSGYSKLAADVNNDGILNFADRQILSRFILGPSVPLGLSSFPAFNQPWRFIPEFIPQNFSTGFNANPFSVNIGGTPITSMLYTSFNWLYDRPAIGQMGYDAVKIGDVNSSWPSGSDDSPCEKIIPLGDEPVLIANNTALLQGDTVNFAVKANNFQDLQAFQLGFHLDTDKFEILGVNEPGLSTYDTENSFGTALKADGIVTTLWYNENYPTTTVSLANGSKLFNIKAKVKQAISDLQSAISIDHSNFPSHIWANPLATPTTMPSLEISAELLSLREGKNAIVTQVEKLRCVPNPITSEFRLVYDAEQEDDSALITIQDLSGRTVYIQKVSIAAGRNIYSMQQLSELPTGTYLAAISTLGNHIQTKVVKAGY